ncbi:MAG: GerMN domain-containing protein [Candidatus Omnitrophica bacterium]|nr:GerMN domain-containing protein [Candidatus Omnitrophota bacterium]MCM8827846.1 GerMN domain-containing protein [Candidatus Omnitrophota bacterium]
MGSGKVNMQKRIVTGLLILWAALLIVFGLVRSGVITSRKVVVYFFQNTKDGSLSLVSTSRQISAVIAMDISEKIKFAMSQLIEGPEQEEIDQGYISCVPSEARVIDVRIQDKIIYVDFSKEIESGGGISEIKGRLAQMVFTATQFDPEAGVRILIEGKEIKSFSGEGITDVEKPMYRNDFSFFLQGESNER